MIWVGLIQSVEGLKRKRLRSPEEEGILSPDCLGLKTSASTLPWVSSLPSCSVDFRLASHHIYKYMSLSLSLSPPLLLPLSLSLIYIISLNIYLSYWLYFSGEL